MPRFFKKKKVGPAVLTASQQKAKELVGQTTEQPTKLVPTSRQRRKEGKDLLHTRTHIEVETDKPLTRRQMIHLIKKHTDEQELMNWFVSIEPDLNKLSSPSRRKVMTTMENRMIELEMD